MRDLNPTEVQDMIDIDGGVEGWPGRYIEAKVSELAAANIGAACCGPDTFKLLNKKYPHRNVRGFLIDPDENGDVYLIGMIAIKMQTETTAEKIEKISMLRFDSEADPSTTLNGFMIFEDE